MNKKNIRALALFSGGLDSVLAMKLIINQGIDVIAVYIDTGFGSTKDKAVHLKNMTNQIGAKLEILDLKDKFLQEILFNPKYGYGKNFNPCIDCHGFMFRETKRLLEKYDASFMISGEVVGQRPMSQRVVAMKQVGELSCAAGIIIRPLSAKLLPISQPEIDDIVDRELLLDISGRSRKRQMALAKEFGLENYEPPAGGCLLTEEQFSKKLRDFVEFDKLALSDIDILKVGRHLRLPDGAKLVVGRNQDENEILKEIKSDKYYQIKLIELTGPFSLISKNASKDDLDLATKIVITYSKSEDNKNYSVDYGNFTLESTKFESKSEAQKYLI
jgi:tRNA-specific 2-thiouridylase